MALLIGQHISGRELEQLTSGWPPDRFASLCNDLVWAVSGRQYRSLPELNDRIYAPDGGVDAQWDIKEDGGAIQTPIVGPGWNVYQYKKRDLIAQDRSRIISKLKSDLKGAVGEIAESHNRRPDRYILFINVDLKHDQFKALKEAMIEGYNMAAETHVEIIGAQLMATFLNDNPHLKAAYFTPFAFKTWEEAYKGHRSSKPFGADVDLIGREEDVERLRSLVDDPRVRVVLLTGPHDIGKSRLALEGTRHRPQDMVVAVDPCSMSLMDYRNLCASHHDTVCIVEDPEPDSVGKLINEILTMDNLKVIVTLLLSKGAYMPSYGQDERIQTVQLEHLSADNASKLLSETKIPLDFRIRDWIIVQAGGIPGILLAAASVAENLTSAAGDFIEKVGEQFEGRIKRELGSVTLQAASLFSLMTHVGVSGQYSHEIEKLCSVFARGFEAHHALLALKDLTREGIAKIGGSFAEISIPLVAWHLARKMLVGRQDKMFALFGKLDGQGRIRFLRRLSELPKNSEVEKFWDEFFGPGGLLGDFESALDMHYLLRLVSDVAPEKTLRLLESGLLKSSEEERLSIEGEARRELVRVLERLLMQKEASGGAVRLLWLLAQAENENYGNNATGVFKKTFNALNPHVTLPYADRLNLLKSFTSDDSPKEGKIVAVNALSESLQSTWFMAPEYAGVLPPEVLRHSFDEFKDYALGIKEIAFRLAEDKSEEVSDLAKGILPGLLFDLSAQADAARALDGMEAVVAWALEGRTGIEVSSLASTLELMRDRFERLMDEHKGSEEELKGCKDKDRVDDLMKKLESGNFETRLKSWAGNWRRNDYQESGSGEYVSRSEQELKKLAEQAVKKPGLLTDSLLKWLLSPRASKSHYFFPHLGREDRDKLFLGIIEELGKDPAKSRFFASYWQGWAERDREGAEARLDELIRLKAVSSEAIVDATSFIEPGSKNAVDRTCEMIVSGRVDAAYAGHTLAHPRWLTGLDVSEFEKLLGAVAGDNLEHAGAAIVMLYYWLYTGKQLAGDLIDFAWRCLESDPELKRVGGMWCFDKLAKNLAKENPERGFALFEKLSKKEYYGKRYLPLGFGNRHGLWDSLHEFDKNRLLKLTLELSRKGLLMDLGVSELLDQKGDADSIISLGKENVEDARTITKFIDWKKDRESFWHIVFALVEAFPDDEQIRRNLSSRFDTGMIVGFTSEFYEDLKEDIEARLKDPAAPAAAKPWLQEMLDRLTKDIKSRVVWEYDLNVADLQRYIEDKDSPERIWAIGRVLKYASMEDIRKLLNPEDIDEALPHIDLPDKRRRALERALKVWLNE